MPNCTEETGTNRIECGRLGGRVVEGRFDGGSMSGDAAVMLLSEHEVLVNQFIASFKSAPEDLVLDFDATDNPPHGQQEGRFFHGYYDCHCYCYLPLYVFCGQQSLCAYLRGKRNRND